MKKFMCAAVDLSFEGMRSGKGGPFGSVIVKDGAMIGKGHNKVTSTNDPTAHGEIVAIRDACHNLGTHDLAGCEIYTSSEPCVMCLGAIYGAGIDAVYYANTVEDAAEIGFADVDVFEELKRPPEERRVKYIQIDDPRAITAFKEWASMSGKKQYFKVRA